MEPTPTEMALRDKIIKRVTDLAHGIFGGKDKCQVLTFGSQVTGLCLPGSDIDFVIRFPSQNGTKNGKSGEDKEEDFTITSNPLHKFADAVKNEFGIRSEEVDDTTNKLDGRDNHDSDSEHLSYLEVIEQTRVPLVKFTVAPYNLDIDVCFDQPNGPEAAELMHRFMESMPPLRPLTFVLKYFLASREINKPFSGGIGSYLLQLMIVSYLQHRTREDVSRNFGGAGRHFNLGSMLLDFLELYGLDYNYVTTAISVRHDGYYFPKGQDSTKPVFWQPSRPFSLSVENPLDPGMDVGAGAFRMQMISRVLGHAFKTLLAYVSEPVEPTESILGMIIPPTEEMRERLAALKKNDVAAAASSTAVVDLVEGDEADVADVAEDGDKGGGPPAHGHKRKRTSRNKHRRREEPKDRSSSSSKSKRKRGDNNASANEQRHSGGWSLGGGHSGKGNGGGGGGSKNKNKRKKDKRNSR